MLDLGSQINQASVRITAYRQYDDGLRHPNTSTSTGFWWSHNEELYLITNWHCVTGKNNDTSKDLGSFAPSHLSLSYKSFTDLNRSKRAIYGQSSTIPLFDSDYKRNWIEHPDGQSIDLVAIPCKIELPHSRTIQTLNNIEFEDRYEPKLGDDCFIVGYPEGFVGEFVTPIWKRGSIASDPNFNHEGRPMLLVDTLGHKGLSGSPVIVRSSGIHIPNGGTEITSDTVFGEWYTFLGVYSGRVSNEGIGAQLGRTWKVRLIADLFEASA
ncbi:trypsin-like peptidase domain-containing protein [Aliiroseovarius crassostreae]|uniref:trypsin-like peptidase domain-containing protein n=1 Tax=Aliiroseovarius crassostreae TaxID=154981 RepID=UPI003C7A0A17